MRNESDCGGISRMEWESSGVGLAVPHCSASPRRIDCSARVFASHMCSRAPMLSVLVLWCDQT